MPKPKNAPDTLLVDLDGTTYSYPEYAAFTFRAMMHTLVEATGQHEEEVVRHMRQHYSTHGIESPFLMQSLKANGFFQEDLQEEEENGLQQKIRAAFNAAKTNHLKPYPGILQVLEEAQKGGREVIALTDADELATSSKMSAYKTKHIDSRHFSRLIALDGSSHAAGEQQRGVQEAEADRLRRQLRIPVSITPREKPESDLEALLGMTRSKISQTVGILGDNYHRDMALAKAYNMYGYHALWGVMDLRTHEEEIGRFTGGTGPIPRSYAPLVYPSKIRPVLRPDLLYTLLEL